MKLGIFLLFFTALLLTGGYFVIRQFKPEEVKKLLFSASVYSVILVVLFAIVVISSNIQLKVF